MVEILAIYGLCFGLMNDKIVGLRLIRRIPFLDEMLNCAYCTGFHSGWIVRLCLDGSLLVEGGLGAAVVRLLLWGLAGASTCYVVDTIVQKVEQDIGE